MKQVAAIGVLLLFGFAFMPGSKKAPAQAPQDWCQKELDRLIQEGADPIEAKREGSLEACNFGATLG